MSITEILQYPFLQRALLGGLIIAVLCALLGVFITLRRESYLTDAVAHASLAGVAIALFVSFAPTPFALIVGVIMAIGITYLKKHTTIATDALIGIFYSFLFATGILILNLSPTYQPELTTYIFGSLLSIGQTDLIYALIVFIITAFIIFRFYRQLLYITFDPESAFLRGIDVVKLEYLLSILASIVIIISIKVVGIVLVTALFVIPATTAKLSAHSFRQMLPLSIFQSIISVFVGILLSFVLNTPPGATIVIVSGLIFGLAFMLLRLSKR